MSGEHLVGHDEGTAKSVLLDEDGHGASPAD